MCLRPRVILNSSPGCRSIFLPVLAQCAAAERLVLVGPSVGGPPDPLFARGITLLGGSWVEDPAAFIDTLTAGTPAGGSLRKAALSPADWPGWDALLRRL